MKMALRLLVFGLILLFFGMGCATVQQPKHPIASSDSLRVYDHKDSRPLNTTPPITVVNKPDSPKLDNPKKLSTGDYYALVIGINDYQHIPRLKTALNDARTVASILQNEYGFTVTTLLNQQATRENILDKLQRLEGSLNKNDNLLIYYAGHGYFDKKTKKAYWLPVKAKNPRHTWIIADSITSSLTANTAKNILIVSDSCYSGTLTRGWTPTPKTNRYRYLQEMLNTRSRLLLASGGNEPVSDSGGQGHSIFAKHFLKGLRNMDESVFTAGELFEEYIKVPVRLGSEQTPEFQHIRKSGDEADGDFVFQKSPR